MRFPDFEFVTEYTNLIAGKHCLRLYRSRFSPEDQSQPIKEYRWHLGFPKFLVQPLCPLLETTPYWGEKHWREEDDFWIWFTILVSEDIPTSLAKELRFRIKAYNKVLNFIMKGEKLGK